MRFSITYQIQELGGSKQAKARAEALCYEQTVELLPDLVPVAVHRQGLIGNLERLAPVEDGRYKAVISYSAALLGDDIAQLLNVTFGMASLRPGVRLTNLDFPEEILAKWPGPRLGRSGLRDRLKVYARPLVCGVLKPIGLSPKDLAERAYRMAKGGLDFVKDDQGFMDQSICPFDERIEVCAEAVAKANNETGGQCLYVSHVTGSAKGLYKRAVRAKRVGAGGLLICPGLSGFDAVRIIAQDSELDLPILTHPSFLGTYYVDPDSGIAPSVLFGQLPRLAGADVSIYPSFTQNYPVTKDDAVAIASKTGLSWGQVQPTFPSAAGGMNRHQIRDVFEVYQDEVVVVIGGDVQQEGDKLTEACEKFMHQVGRNKI